MAMVDMDGTNESQHKSVGSVWELVDIWHSVSIHQMNQVNSHNGLPWWQQHKHHPGYYY